MPPVPSNPPTAGRRKLPADGQRQQWQPERLLVDPRLCNGSNSRRGALHRPNQCAEHQLLDRGYGSCLGECRGPFHDGNSSNWGTLVASTPILFGGNAAAYGLMPNKVYYVASETHTEHRQHHTPSRSPRSGSRRCRRTMSRFRARAASPGPIVTSIARAASALSYGMVKPVTQLGSHELAADQLARDADGSLTCGSAQRLPRGAPASNWIPTPNHGVLQHDLHKAGDPRRSS